MRKPKLPPQATPPKGATPKPVNIDLILKNGPDQVDLTPIKPNPHLKGK